MKTLNISGIILDNADEFFDCTGAAEFVAELATVDDDLTVCINSVGGSVLGGRSMGIALTKWCSEHKGRTLTIEVGALAASAAANLVVSAPKSARVVAYNDSLFMFHSCSGEVSGTPDELKDVATQMQAINDGVIRALLRKTTLDEATVRSWFESGREGWLDGREALECGLIDELLDGDMEDTDFTSMEVYNCKQIVATYKEIRMKKKQKIEDEAKTNAVVAEATEPEKENEVVTATAETPETPETTETTETATAETAVTAEAEVAENPEATEAENQNEEAENPEANKQEEEIGSGEIEALKAENGELKGQVEALKAELEALKAKMTAGMTATAKGKPEKKTFAELMKEIPKGLSASAYGKAFAKLKAEHKAEYDEYMNSHQSRSFN